MNTAFTLDQIALAYAAQALRDAMLKEKEKFEGYGEARVINYALTKLNPILDLCIAQELDEPFDFIGYMGKIMGDELSFQEISEPYNILVNVALGGIDISEFHKTEFYRRMPRQLGAPPEYVPSEADQRNIERDLKLKPGN